MLADALASSGSATDPVSVVDVGAGTGANQTWLAPALREAGFAGPQDWHLLDHDAGLLEVASRSTEELPGVHSTRHTARVTDVAGLLPRLRRPRVITCSALLDLLTAAEIDHLVGATLESGQAALWALSVTGTVAPTPQHPGDHLVSELFNADQQRTLDDDRALLGPTAWSYAADRLRAGGWDVHTVSTPWQLGPADAALLRRWVDERADAAAGASDQVDVRSRVGSWAAARRSHLDDGVLSVRVGHTDLLALPDNVISVQTSSPSW
jgi:hypothetical protein